MFGYNLKVEKDKVNLERWFMGFLVKVKSWRNIVDEIVDVVDWRKRKEGELRKESAWIVGVMYFTIWSHMLKIPIVFSNQTNIGKWKSHFLLSTSMQKSNKPNTPFMLTPYPRFGLLSIFSCHDLYQNIIFIMFYIVYLIMSISSDTWTLIKMQNMNVLGLQSRSSAHIYGAPNSFSHIQAQ